MKLCGEMRVLRVYDGNNLHRLEMAFGVRNSGAVSEIYLDDATLARCGLIVPERGFRGNKIRVSVENRDDAATPEADDVYLERVRFSEDFKWTRATTPPSRNSEVGGYAHFSSPREDSVPHYRLVLPVDRTQFEELSGASGETLFRVGLALM